VSAPSALPLFAEWTAPAAWQVVDFISDLHLGEDTPRGFDAWATYLLSTPADAVVILGDLFEVWVGDDARVAGFEARCAEVLKAAAARRPLAFMVGNRDFLVGSPLLAECGVRALPDPCVLVLGTERILLSHGDLLCLADVDYQKFRAMVRSAEWQSTFLALPLAERRLQARHMREQSRLHNQGRPDSDISELDLPATLSWMQEAGTPDFIHGHTHRPSTQVLSPGFVRHVLSDWELDHGGQSRAEVLRWQRGTLTRLPPTP
jgi:UDP-2,3-diacylglucosamine hydrolase